MKQPLKRSTAALPNKFAVAFAGLLAALALLLPGFANAAAMVDTIVVKYRDDALAQDATRLPDSDRALLGHMRKANFVEIGRNATAPSASRSTHRCRSTKRARP